MDSILDNIGNTPLVRINTITKEEGVNCEIREFFALFPRVVSESHSRLLYYASCRQR
jgi:hypothetical protein